MESSGTRVGQRVLDLLSKASPSSPYYIYDGSSDLEDVVFYEVSAGLDIEGVSNMKTLLAPNLVALSGNTYIYIQGNPDLLSVNLPVLEDVSNYTLYIVGNSHLTNISIPNLSLAGHLYFENNALTQACVDAILARLVLVGYSGGEKTVNLSGGDNAVPGTQGLLDKVTLQDAGITVLINT